MRRILTAVLIMIFTSAAVFAEAEYQEFDNAGMVAAKYLDIGTGAAAGGMGNAYLGMAKDAVAIYWNPAGLNNMQNEKKQWNFFFSQNIWLQEMMLSHAAVAKYVQNAGVFGLSLSYFNAGEIEKTYIASNGDPIVTENPDTYMPYSLILSAAYSNVMDENLDYGVVLKYLMDSIDGDAAHAYSVDFGLRYMFGPLPGLSFNLVAKNFGGTMGGSILAKEFSFAAMYTVTAGDITFSADYDICGKVNNYPVHRIGAEIILPYKITLRAGYQTDNTTETEGFKNFTLGAGINISDKFIDFALEPYGDFGTSYRISFGGDF